jgi:hypothetical protein
MSAPQKKKKTTKSKDSIETSVEIIEANITTSSVEENKTETILEEFVETTNTISDNIVTDNIVTDNIVTDNVVTDNVVTDNVVTDNTTILDPNQIKEEIKEKINEVISVQIPVNLVDLVKEEIKQKAHILNKEYIDILNSLVGKSPKLLNDIEKSMFEIMKDGKIDSNDIPYLITIIQKLYEFLFSLKIKNIQTEKRAAICAEIIKFIVQVLIKERRIKVDINKQDIFLSQFNALMDSCISLLSLQSGLISRSCCCCFSKK